MTANPSDSFSDRELAEVLDAEVDERRGRVLLLRLAGKTYTAISKELKVSLTTVRNDYQAALAAQHAITPEQGIARQMAIITDIVRANYPAMMRGDKDAAGSILKALDREAKLNGWDAPTRVLAAVNTTDMSNEAAALIERIKGYDADFAARGSDDHKELEHGHTIIEGELGDTVGGAAGGAAPHSGDDARDRSAVEADGDGRLRPVDAGSDAGGPVSAGRDDAGGSPLGVPDPAPDPDDDWADVDD